MKYVDPSGWAWFRNSESGQYYYNMGYSEDDLYEVQEMWGDNWEFDHENYGWLQDQSLLAKRQEDGTLFTGMFSADLTLGVDNNLFSNSEFYPQGGQCSAVSFIDPFFDLASDGISGTLQLAGLNEQTADVAADISLIAGFLLLAKPGVGAKRVAKTGNSLVYTGLDATGTIRYVGITEREAVVRFGEHLSSGTARSLLDYRVFEGATSLTRTQARVLEQTLINQYGLQKNGGLLLNKINSIAPKYWLEYSIK